MRNKILKNALSFLMLVAIFVPAFVLALPALAQPDLGTEYATNLELVTTDEDPRDVAVNIVRYLMTFLGIIAVVIILLGGFKWMTAAGNEDKVAEAKKVIAAGAIGLVVILASFAIVTFVIESTSDMLANGTI